MAHKRCASMHVGQKLELQIRGKNIISHLVFTTVSMSRGEVQLNLMPKKLSHKTPCISKSITFKLPSLWFHKLQTTKINTLKYQANGLFQHGKSNQRPHPALRTRLEMLQGLSCHTQDQPIHNLFYFSIHDHCR